jgi:predicted Zn finger-like uncharacterized protein
MPNMHSPQNALCPNCHTRFVLRPGQLGAQRGLVRCGLCLHIFNPLATPSDVTPSVARTSPFAQTAPKRKRAWRWFSYLLIAGMALILALTLFFRNSLVQYFPNSAIILQPVCRLLSCTLSPVQYIDALEIAHSELLTGPVSDSYRLRIILHNQANFTITLPALELSLIDTQGKLISRQTFNVRDYLSSHQQHLGSQGLPKKASLPLEITLRSKANAASYQLFLFYPN